ncbi:MAG: alpha/beta hydrolase [Gordonia paraffinivorans]
MTTHIDIRIPRGPLTLAGTLHRARPADEPAPAVVVSTPGSSVRGQIGANYGRRLAAAGVTALVFDPAFQGESDGEPRDLEDPYERAADIRHAVDHLSTLADVDGRRIGALGICAGGGYAAHTAMTDHRIRALAVVVPVNIGRARRQGDPTPGAVAAALRRAAEQRSVEAAGGEPVRVPWLPDTRAEADAAGITDIDVLQAIDFYRTDRGRDEHSTNRRVARGDAQVLGFDAFHLAGELLTQPLLVVVGGRQGTTGSFADGQHLYELAPNKDAFVVVEGAGHYEMYDEPRFVDPTVARLADFFSRHLSAERADSAY